MRIDGTNKIGQPGPDPLDAQRKASVPARDKSQNDGLVVNQQLEPLVAKAKVSEEVDAQAVAEAKKMLAAGELDSPETIRRAAETLLKYGI